MKSKNANLLKLNIVHSLPGRIRVRIKALTFLKGYKEEILKVFKEVDVINQCEINCITGSLLLKFNSENISENDILELVEATLSTYAVSAHNNEKKLLNHVDVEERRLNNENPKEIALRLGIAAATLGWQLMSGGYESEIKKGLVPKIFNVSSIICLGLSKSVFKSGVESLVKTKKPNADTLTMSAIITSLIIGSPVSALTTVMLSDIAEFMTAYTMKKTRNAISEMLDMGTDEVWKMDDDGSFYKVPLTKIKQGDKISIQAGYKISVDGEVISGEAFVEQAAITGEYMPVCKRENDEVFAGTVVKTGNIVVQAKRVGDETSVSRIVNMVENATTKKAQMQVYADKFSAQLIPLNFLLSGLIYVVTKSPIRALNMLIIDYSCGVRLSTATALSATIHTAATNNILIKGGNVIEEIAESDTIVLDKTGTMTEGKPKVMSVIVASEDISTKEVLALASAAEETATHPLSVAIMTKVNSKGIKVPSHTDTKTHVGRGVSTVVKDKVVRVGSVKFMKENNIDISGLEEDASRLVKMGQSIMYVSYDEKVRGIVGVHDALRENMKKSLNRLRNLKIDDIRLLTGDSLRQAEIVAKKMSVDGFKFDLMPEDKAREILAAQASGSKVIMVGDGVNDAPSLAYSDVGIALGSTRTDIAIEAADVTITEDNPLLIPGLVDLSKKTMRVIKENFSVTIGVNTLGIVLSALGFLPVVLGSVIHNMTTILVVMNSGRLLFYNFERRP